VWLADEKERVEKVLAQPGNAGRIIVAFQRADPTTFATLMAPLLRVVEASNDVKVALRTSVEFIPSLLSRLSSPKAEVCPLLFFFSLSPPPPLPIATT
jgi:hypothetical protein